MYDPHLENHSLILRLLQIGLQSTNVVSQDDGMLRLASVFVSNAGHQTCTPACEQVCSPSWRSSAGSKPNVADEKFQGVLLATNLTLRLEQSQSTTLSRS